jgi:hypothetical protein
LPQNHTTPVRDGVAFVLPGIRTAAACKCGVGIRTYRLRVICTLTPTQRAITPSHFRKVGTPCSCSLYRTLLPGLAALYWGLWIASPDRRVRVPSALDAPRVSRGVVALDSSVRRQQRPTASAMAVPLRIVRCNLHIVCENTVYRVLTVVYDTQNYWGSGLCPSSGILNTRKHLKEGYIPGPHRLYK